MSYICILGSFSKVNVQKGVFFFWGGGLLKFQILFWGALKIPDIFGGEGERLGPSLHM